MTDDIGTSPEELRAHAAKLQGFEDRLKTALDAANQVSMGSEAYGKICAFFVPVVRSVSQPGTDALRNTSDVLGDLAAKVKNSANTYESSDARGTHHLNQVDK